MEVFVEKEQAKLPQEISLISLIQSRYSEIKQIIKDFKKCSPKLASQKLPIHMRRRAASHNVNRLPSRTRKIIAKKSKGNDKVSELKEKKRKQQKKHRNPRKVELSHAVRDAKSDRSLLHLWFVKRFKMIIQFNQLIPDFNTTKNLRKLQRMSKSGCIHFYFPHLKSIIIRIANIDLVHSELNKMIADDLDSFLDTRIPLGFASTSINFLKSADQNHGIIGPGYLIFDKKNQFLIIWCHSEIHLEIHDYLATQFFGSSNEVIDGQQVYQFFSLIGSESLNHMKKFFGEDCPSIPADFQNGTIFSIPNRNLLNDSEKNILSIRKDSNENVAFGEMIVHLKRSHNRDVVLLSVPYSKAKDFWYKLVKNRTHLVGGLRDIQLLASEMRCLHYPTIGYPDLPGDLNCNREIWTKIIANRDYAVVRDQLIISKLKNPTLSLIEDLLKYNSDLRTSLIYVEIISINRGTPEKGDIICLPTPEDIQKYIGRSKMDIKIDEIGYGPTEPQKLSKGISLEKSSRPIIGLIEFGYFSYDLGAGKGYGAITFKSLTQLTQLKSDKLVALTRSSKSNTFRFIELLIDHFENF